MSSQVTASSSSSSFTRASLAKDAAADGGAVATIVGRRRQRPSDTVQVQSTNKLLVLSRDSQSRPPKVYGLDQACVYQFDTIVDTFNGVKKRFVYPFNQINLHHHLPPTTLPTLSTQAHTVVISKQVQVWKSLTTSLTRGLSHHHSGHEWLLDHHEEGSRGMMMSEEAHLRLEMAQHPPNVTFDQILDLQELFYTCIPLSMIDATLTSDEKDTLFEFLQCSEVQYLIGFSMHYLYQVLFSEDEKVKTSGTRESPAETKTRQLYVLLLDVCHQLKQSIIRPHRKGLRLYYPLVLLSIRMTVDTLFIVHYPRWFIHDRAFRKERTQEQMKVILDEVFDADMVYTRLSPLESSGEALHFAKVLQHHRNNPSRDRRNPYYMTSPIVKQIFSSPASSESRRLLVQSSGPTRPTNAVSRRGKSRSTRDSRTHQLNIQERVRLLETFTK